MGAVGLVPKDFLQTPRPDDSDLTHPSLGASRKALSCGAGGGGFQSTCQGLPSSLGSYCSILLVNPVALSLLSLLSLPTSNLLGV